MRQEAQKLFGADRFWLVESHRGHLPIYSTQGIGRMRSANRALAASRAWASGAVLASGAEVRHSKSAHLGFDWRFGD